MIKETISIPIYDAELRVVIADDYEGFESAVYDTGYGGELKGAGAIVLRHEEALVFHLIMNKEDISYGNVAHECLHVTNKIMNHIGMHYDWYNDEAMCYLHGFVVDCVHKIIENENRD